MEPQTTMRTDGAPAAPSNNPSDLLTIEELAAHLKISVWTVDRMRSRRTGPAFIKLGGGLKGCVRYRRAAVDLWVMANEVHPAAYAPRRARDGNGPSGASAAAA